MNLIGLMLVRNESWILNLSLEVALRWCDGVIVLDHASTDDTPEILKLYANDGPEGMMRVIRHDDGTRWDEMDLRQRLLQMGRDSGGTHFAMIDADEVLTHNHLPRIREWAAVLNPGEVLELPMVAPWGNLDQYRADDSVWSRSILSLVFADSPEMGWAPRGAEKYQHHNRVPHGATSTVSPPGTRNNGGVFHFQWCNWGRVVSKHRWYGVTERLRYPTYSVEVINHKYSQAISDKTPRCRDIPPEWWGDYAKSDIVLGQTPWHDEDTRRMLALEPPEYWTGLNLRGWEMP